MLISPRAASVNSELFHNYRTTTSLTEFKEFCSTGSRNLSEVNRYLLFLSGAELTGGLCGLRLTNTHEISIT